MVRIFLEVLDIWDSHYCACTCSAIAILLVVLGSCLKVSSSGGSSLKETSWAISAKVFTWKVAVRLMTMGIIFTSTSRVPLVFNASRSGPKMSYMWSMIVCMLPSVEYLHYII